MFNILEKSSSINSKVSLLKKIKNFMKIYETSKKVRIVIVSYVEKESIRSKDV
jgi:hypothetical protein